MVNLVLPEKPEGPEEFVLTMYGKKRNITKKTFQYLRKMQESPVQQKRWYGKREMPAIPSFYYPYLFLNFSHLHRADLQRQTEQCNKSGCILVIIQIAGCEQSCEVHEVMLLRKSGGKSGIYERK